MRSLPLISFELLFKIGNSKSSFFVNAFVDKIKILIEPNIKRSYDNPLDKLLQVDQEFEKQRKESKIVKDLIDFCFGKSDDKLTEKNVMQELIKNPKVDHQWYRMIENSRKYQ